MRQRVHTGAAGTLTTLRKGGIVARIGLPVLYSALCCVLSYAFSCMSTGQLAQAAEDVDTAPLNRTPAVREAFAHFYTLDYDGALSRFRIIEAAHPEDPIAVDYVLDTMVFQTLYGLDLLDTTLYAHNGFLTGRHPVNENKETTNEVNRLADKAIGLAEKQLKENPKDVNALFARAWARSVHATYIALVEHSYVAALRQALQARGDDDKVLELDPDYVDAELVVGVHQYVVGSLPTAFKLMAGIAGIHGDKAKGIAMLRDDGQRGVITSVQARTALMLFLRREGKYDQAEAIADSLKNEFPHNFLFWLEEANLHKDAGQADDAIAAYRALLTRARKPGYFTNARLQLAWFGLAETLRGQKRESEAAAAFQQALAQPAVGPDLRRRSELGLGMEYDLLHQRDKAVSAYKAVVGEGESSQATEAKRYLKSPYEGGDA
jgi:tetratricopeptide (TPR) repeat protein